MRKYLSFLFIICLLFISCATSPRQQLEQELDVASYVPESFDWDDVCPGVARFDFENAEIPLIYHAVKIDLGMAGAGTGIGICEDVEAGNYGELQLVCSRGERVSDFALRENCVVAVNATPFGKGGELVGIHREAGCDLSVPLARYAAIGFADVDSESSEGLFARIFESQGSGELADFTYAFGGFFVVLEKGEVRREFVRRGDSRSGAGLSADGRTLYLLVVEGERPSKSVGLSYPQCGELFKAMGCTDALEFDGGGSAELCINGKSVLSYKVRRVHGNGFGFTVR